MEFPPEEVARRRADLLDELSSRVIDEYNARKRDTRETVLCEGFDGTRYFGRSYAESPDIDGRIWFTAPGTVTPGEFVTVRIDGAEDGELYGHLEEDEA